MGLSGAPDLLTLSHLLASFANEGPFQAGWAFCAKPLLAVCGRMCACLDGSRIQLVACCAIMAALMSSMCLCTAQLSIRRLSYWLLTTGLWLPKPRRGQARPLHFGFVGFMPTCTARCLNHLTWLRRALGQLGSGLLRGIAPMPREAVTYPILASSDLGAVFAPLPPSMLELMMHFRQVYATMRRV